MLTCMYVCVRVGGGGGRKGWVVGGSAIQAHLTKCRGKVDTNKTQLTLPF